MRVIAGTARGKNLQALPGEDITRPTINRVKEAMFSSVQFLVKVFQHLTPSRMVTLIKSLKWP